MLCCVASCCTDAHEQGGCDANCWFNSQTGVRLGCAAAVAGAQGVRGAARVVCGTAAAAAGVLRTLTCSSDTFAMALQSSAQALQRRRAGLSRMAAAVEASSSGHAALLLLRLQQPQRRAALSRSSITHCFMAVEPVVKAAVGLAAWPQ